MAVIIRESLFTTLNLTNLLNINLDPSEKHQSWVRWIYASINTHFLERKGPLPLYIEGDERTLQEEAEFYELRVDGPYTLQPQKGCYYANVEINVLVQAHMDSMKLYSIQDAIGYIIRAFTNAICVYRYGDGQFDDQSLLGTLKLQRQIDEYVAVNYFGIVKENVRLTQATIEGHYRMEL